MYTHRIAGAAAAAAVAAALITAGCGTAEEVVNKGGDTPCSEFVAQDGEKQRVTVRKFLEQEQSSTTEPSADTVDAAIVSIKLMCQAQANPETPIKEADLTGIFVPK
ncbi:MULTISPECIES: hypothetical protein [Nocardia]|uniref:Acid stress chaperone HdeA n=1 Tax=Nocardia otitidiscaviarum TaxID=1823 RepID=A0A516NJZ2_9NOCA|nr:MULTISPECIES: hypothetical protein [Nocardia]MBF6180222.1 hypothetical protein [Nocardia otitidiscaviarum]MCP9625158.1 hypothetical protein [Nocardia otitidiscaviarum]QDP79199.1 hypothetical protein FOH10_11145 [Nocardia otitidiscaviarum]